LNKINNLIIDREKNKNLQFFYKLFDEHLIWVLLILSILIISIFMKQFFNITNIINIILNSSILGILVIAEVFCLLIGKFDLSIESTLGFAALVGGTLSIKFNINPIIAWSIALLSGLIIGLFNGLMIVKVGVNPFLQTLSMYIILRGLMVTISGGVALYPLPNFFLFFGAIKVLGIPIPVIILIISYVVFSFILQKRPFGRILYFVGTNPTAAFASGINVNRITIMVFTISGLIAAFCGLVFAGRLESIPITMGKGMIFEVFAAAVLGGVSLSGGKGSLIGALGGVLFLGIIGSMLTWFGVNAFLVEAIRGVIILIAIVLDAIKNRYRLRLIKI
jgi:ribose/xylose/arabinose/galactoside ABC-type transport system permease subunit